MWTWLYPSIEKCVSYEDVDHSYENIKLAYFMIELLYIIYTIILTFIIIINNRTKIYNLSYWLCNALKLYYTIKENGENNYWNK